jgi:hypothetical protein
MNDDVIQLYNITNIDEINRCIDRLPEGLTHYDAAIIVYMILKNIYKYHGKNKWEYFDLRDRMWKIDIYRNRLKADIRTVVSDAFLKRSMYWYNLSKLHNDDVNDMNSKNYISNRILQHGSKLQNDKFISVVIRESRGFFDIHRYD